MDNLESVKEAEKNTQVGYMMLSRLQLDVDYWNGCGNFYNRILCGDSPKAHYEEMKKIWISLPRKPKWLRAVDFIKYRDILLSGKGHL